MDQSIKSDLLKRLKVMAVVYNKNATDELYDVYMSLLTKYDPNLALKALDKILQENKFFPTIAEIIEVINSFDGRPTAEEAWSMLPFSEDDSVVWTDEMRQAFFEGAYPLLESDMYGARRAFESVYERLVKDARNLGSSVHWETSLGHDKHKRFDVIVDAAKKNRISIDYAQRIACQTVEQSSRFQEIFDSSYKRENDANLLILNAMKKKALENDSKNN